MTSCWEQGAGISLAVTVKERALARAGDKRERLWTARRRVRLGEPAVRGTPQEDEVA